MAIIWDWTRDQKKISMVGVVHSGWEVVREAKFDGANTRWVLRHPCGRERYRVGTELRTAIKLGSKMKKCECGQ